MKIGVLAFQGGVIEHIKQIEALGHDAIEVKKEEDLEGLDGIILPGGESTTMGKLLRITNLLKPLKRKIEEVCLYWYFWHLCCCGLRFLVRQKTLFWVSIQYRLRQGM